MDPNSSAQSNAGVNSGPNLNGPLPSGPKKGSEAIYKKSSTGAKALGRGSTRVIPSHPPNGTANRAPADARKTTVEAVTWALGEFGKISGHSIKNCYLS